MKKKQFVAVCLMIFAIIATSNAQIEINPASRSFTKDGGGGSVLTSGSGDWTASTAAGWLTITPRTTGSVGESCIYVVDSNFSANNRVGLIDISGNTHTVNQTGYSATLSPTTVTVEYQGGSGQISITTDAGVSWTAVANNDWVSVTPSSGISAGTVSYTVAPYSGVTLRTTSLTIAGQTFSITQNGTDVNISPYSVEKSAGSDIVQVQVSALWDTSWSVVPDSTWISVVDAGAGAGDSTITLAIGTNPSYQYRTGTVQIGSAIFNVTQLGSPNPVLAINPPEATADPVGAYGNVAVLATPDAPWTAESLDPWLIISDGSEGAGNGNIQYVVSSNPNLSNRTGRIRIYPAVYEARSDLSLQLFAHIYNGSDDASGWCHDLSGSLTRRFDGTQPWTLTGQDFYRNNDAFTFAFWFNIGNPDTINRLLGVTRADSSYTAIYIDAANHLNVNCAGEILTTSLLVEPDEEYQLVVAVDSARTVTVYAGKRGESIVEVGNRTFASAPFPQPYVTPQRIQIGAAHLPSDGNLTDASINDFRVYGRELSAYEAEKLFEFSGTATPYGNFSQNGDTDAVRVEYNLQGQGLVAGGCSPPAPFTPTFEQFHSKSSGFSTSWELIYTHNVFGKFVHQIKGAGSTSWRVTWYYRFYYTDGTAVSLHWQASDAGTFSYIQDNPNPDKPVDLIEVFAFKDNSYSASLSSSILISNELQEIYLWSPSSDRFSLPDRALDGTSASRIVLNNQQSSFSTASATYNFWMRFDFMPVSGMIPVLQRSEFSCSLLPYGDLQFALNGTNREYVADLQAGRWHLITIAGQYGGSAKFYVDGAEIGNTPDFGSYQFGTNSSQQDLVIGGWQGAIDYAGFYDGQLTSPQIQAIYDKQKPQTLYHVVTQGVVTPSIDPESTMVSAAGGSTSTMLTLAHNVNWTAEANDTWLLITSSTNGAGSTTVEMSVDQNPTVYQRQGTIIVAGEIFTINQGGLGSSVSAVDTIFGTDGGGAWIDVSTEGNAQWQAVSEVSWLTVAIGASGSGAGSVFIVADPYTQTSSSRIGAVTIAGHTVYFTQRGFELSVSPQVAQVGSNAGAGEFGVAAPVGAIWEAIATHPWITIVGGTSGQGNGTVRYSIAENTTGVNRTGRIIVAGQEYTLTQTASLLMTAYSDGGGSVSGSGSYETLATATLTATPDTGYFFSHWIGDAVGSENPLAVSMDSSKTVKGHFIAEDLADSIALNSKDRLGLFDADQMHGLALGNPVLERDVYSGKMSVVLALEENPVLSGGLWSNMPINEIDVFIESGKIRVDITPNGNAAFYRLQGEPND